MIDETKSAFLQRRRLMGDPLRPRYHFLPPANWMNDPNGLLHWKGQYHLFYQYNPHAAFHDHIHWGHAVSADLVHWSDLPIALTPTPEQADAHGCWSGCAVNNAGVPTLLYSGVHPQVVCLATGDEDLRTWHYYPGNPVIAGPPDDLRAGTNGDFRDPFVWKEGDYWYMLMGSMTQGVGGMILLYRSTDLLNWDYLHPLLVGDTGRREPLWTGVMWECPNLLTFGQQRVLLFSVASQHEPLYAVYVTGTFEHERFTPQEQGMLVHGGYFYAPLVLRDELGRYIMWGWLREGRDGSLSQQAGWAGVMSLPIIVAPRPEGGLSLEPAPELTTLREQHWHYEDLMLDEAEKFLLASGQGGCLEMLIECEPDPNSEFGIRLQHAGDAQEQTRIVYQAYQAAAHSLLIERAQSSTQPGVEREESVMPVGTEPGEPLKMRLFLDRSVLEVFVNKRHYMASRIYPQHHEDLRIELFARAGRIKISSLDVWRLASIW